MEIAVNQQLDTIRSCFDQKIRNGMFKPIVRRLHPDIAEDRSQDALGLAYQQYVRHAEKGRYWMMPCWSTQPACVQKT